MTAPRGNAKERSSRDLHRPQVCHQGDEWKDSHITRLETSCVRCVGVADMVSYLTSQCRLVKRSSKPSLPIGVLQTEHAIPSFPTCQVPQHRTEIASRVRKNDSKCKLLESVVRVHDMCSSLILLSQRNKEYSATCDTRCLSIVFSEGLCNTRF